MRAPDIRKIILEQAERRCMEEGIDPADVKFVCSIALHRFIRRDEFRHVCGKKLFDKYHPRGQMTNYNAVDVEHSVELGFTEAGEKVLVCKDFAEADLMIYANVNYVSMDGGYKSYATGLVHYQTLRWGYYARRGAGGGRREKRGFFICFIHTSALNSVLSAFLFLVVHSPSSNAIAAAVVLARSLSRASALPRGTTTTARR